MAHFLCDNTIDIDVLDTSMKDFNLSLIHI